MTDDTADDRASTTLADAAIAYARAGYEVLPLKPGTKFPDTAHGKDDATSDVDEVREWWNTWPDSNIGLRPAQGVAIIDVESVAGHGVDGHTSLADRIIQLGPLPDAPVAETATGGLHIWLSGVDGKTVPTFGPGIDVKTRSGYVVAPPSVTKDGQYRWRTNMSNDPPLAPDAWREHLRERKPERAPRKTDGYNSTQPVDNEPYVNKALTDLDELANTPAHGGRWGGRNQALNNIGLRLARLGVDREWLRGQLIDACGTNGLVADDGIGSVEKTIRSSFGKADRHGLADVPKLYHKRDNMSEPFHLDDEAAESGNPKVWHSSELTAAKQPRWLARRFIPRAAPTVFCGDEGIGKTLWDMRLVAAVTTGKPLPEIGLPARDPQPVLLAAITEEDWATTVLPRLQVADADIDMVSVICTEADGSGPPIFPRDFDLIREMNPKPALIVVDSWLDTLAMDMVVRDSQSAARALTPWTDLATKTDAGIILLTPTNRLSTGDIREKYGATQHLRKKARMTLFAVRDDETDLLVLGPDKVNVTKPEPAVMYSIDAVQHWDSTEDDDGTVGRLQYVMASDRTIREWVTDTHDQDDGDTTKVDEATYWLRDYLMENAPRMGAGDIKAEAEMRKIASITLRRARQRLRVVVEPVKGVTPYTTSWRLP